MKSRWKGLAACVLGAALCSCSFSRPIARDAVRYNEDLARANNEVLLLNIARASKKHPLFFTTVSTVTRNLSSKGSLAADAPIGAGSDDKYLLKPALEVSGGPTATIAVLDQEKFIRGITTPISMETLQYLWNLGWPREELLLLLVRSLVVEGVEYEGFPLNKEGYRRYHDIIEKLARSDSIEAIYSDDKSLPAAEIPTAFAPATPSIDNLIAAAKNDLGLMRGKIEDPYGAEVDGKRPIVDATWVKSKRRLVGWRFANRGDAEQKLKLETPDASSGTPAQRPPGTKKAYEVEESVHRHALDGLKLVFLLPVIHGEEAVGITTSTPPGASEIFLRSTEGVIYHLGELVRAQAADEGHRPPVRLRTWPGAIKPVLFDAFCTSCGCGDCLLTVDYCGMKLTVCPEPKGNESMHVLSLVSLLLGLHKSADEIPKGGVVTIVGNQ